MEAGSFSKIAKPTLYKVQDFKLYFNLDLILKPFIVL